MRLLILYKQFIYYKQAEEGHDLEQLLTHQDSSRSVAVSAVVNNANTIQYIIHFTWTDTHTHTHTHTHTDVRENKTEIAPTVSSVHVLGHVEPNRRANAEMEHMFQCCQITSVCKVNVPQTKPMWAIV